jgi:hypothetical protein
MCARRFLIAVFILTLLVVAAGFALFQWGGDVLLRQATPKGHFQAARAGGAPDYTLADSWISNPRLRDPGTDDPAHWLPDGVTHGALGTASTFYVHPTTYLMGDRWSAPIHPDPLTEARTQLFVRSQASAFNLAGGTWAPRYRQAAYGAFLLKGADSQKALELAYGDVAAAFDEFLREAPKEGGIILAGHSQGALLLERLLREKVAGRPIARRIVAAYLPGWPISTTADLPALGLPTCTLPQQAGCILSWMSFGDPPNANFFGEWEKTKGLTGGDRRQDEALCVNPLTGTQNGVAPPQLNRGTLIPTANFRSATFQPGLVGARCSSGLLVIEGDIPSYVPPPLPGNNFHIYDYALFWGSIRADAKNRLEAWRP